MPAFAGWPIGKDHYIFGATVSTYNAGNRWDENGDYIVNSGQKFSSTSLGLYGAYGISRRLDISAGLPISYLHTAYEGTSTNYTNLGDLQVGLDYVLFNFKYANYITAYIGTIAPLYSNSTTKTVGLGCAGATVKLANSGNLGSNVFYNIEAGFAQYVGTAAPYQLLGDVSLGCSLNRWNQIGIDGSAVRSISSDKSSSLNVFANRNFDYVKLSANYGHSFTKRVTLNLSYFYTVAGFNTGQGYGGALSLTYKLPYR